MNKGCYYKFVKMELAQFATFDEGMSITDGDEVSVGVNHRFAYNFKSSMVLCRTIVDYSLYQSILLKAELNCIFQIDEESAGRFEKDGKEIALPKELIQQFASLGYSAMRGIIYAKTMGSQLNGIILPLVDVTELVKGDQVFKKD